MIEVWRLVKAPYAESAFDGEGARRYGGRFNSPGRAVVYTSESLALATLEILVNLPTDRLLDSYVAFRARIPDERVDDLSPGVLPPNWRANPTPASVWAVGDAWHQSGRTLALRVPSAVIPREHNVLVNPRHSSFGEVEIEGPLDPALDPRLQT
jgi:RES domain-containing protein